MFFFSVLFGGHQHWMQPVHAHFVEPTLPSTRGYNIKRDTHHSSGSSIGPGSFPCTRCGKVYNWRGNLLRHMRLECGKDPQFQCSYCPYMTKHKNHLLRHVKTRHKDVLEYCQISHDGN